MKKLIILLVLLTACSLQSTVPSGDSGKITVHMKLVKLPDDKGDTLQCIIYSLSNDSGHDYNLPNWILRSRLKFNYSKSDTSLYDIGYMAFDFFIPNSGFSRRISPEEKVLRCYLLSQQQSGDPFVSDSMDFQKMEHELNMNHIRQIFRQNTTLTKKERERIKQELLKHSENDFILLKAGAKMVVGISTNLNNLRNNRSLQNYPTDNKDLFISYMAAIDCIKSDSSWVFAEDIPESLMLNPFDTNSFTETKKIWYYDPEPYPKYKSYYPYLGNITCSDTIYIQSGYFLE